MFGADADWLEGLRQWLLPRLGRAAQTVRHTTGLRIATESRVTGEEFVGQVPLPPEEFEQALVEMGFERNPLATLKQRETDTGDLEEGSWRKIGFDDESMQLHVVIYAASDVPHAEPGSTFVYAHYEKRWDTNPFGHLRKTDFDKQKGCQKMRQLLNRHGYSWDTTRPSAYTDG